MVLMKKKLTSAIIASCLAAGLCFSSGAADGDISVSLNGEKLAFDVLPVIDEGRTLVPFRAIFEALGCAVSYSPRKDGNFVNAMKGEKYLSLKIGSDEMQVGGKTVKLDAAPRIENGRTLVPLRAVSESLNLKVDWDGETKTVSISEKAGQYKIKPGHMTRIVSDRDGTPLINFDCAYPIIEGETDFIRQINSEYFVMAESFIKNIAADTEGDAAALRTAMGDTFRPQEFNLSYDVMLNRNNMISIRMTDYRNYNGAHPSTNYYSRTFQMVLEKELALTDVLDVDPEKVNETVNNAFSGFIAELGKEGDASEVAANIKNQSGNVSWYLNDDALVLYFNQYQVGAYALGTPTATVPYTGPDGIVKIDLSKAQ